jgi:hypothetical protein
LNADNSATGDVDINSGVIRVQASTSRVGIGNTFPASKLHVTGDTTVSGSLILSSSLYAAQGGSAPAGAETAIITLNTGSYTAAFFDYTVSSGSNARAGTVMSVWNGASVQYTDNSTLDIGTTSDITLKVETGGANVQLVAATSTSPWSVKTTYRLI